MTLFFTVTCLLIKLKLLLSRENFVMCVPVNSECIWALYFVTTVRQKRKYWSPILISIHFETFVKLIKKKSALTKGIVHK